MFRYNLPVLVALVVIWAMSAEISNAQKCPPNESYSICGKICEPSCADKDPTENNWLCQGTICYRAFTGSCRCNSDFVRNNTNGPCIPPANCINK